MKNDRNPVSKALVTGASSGLGSCYARQLGARGYHLIITARRLGRLRDLATELENSYGTHVKVIAADLTRRDALAGLEQQIRHETDLELLVNNAGFGISGDYSTQPVEKHQRMIDVHVTATVRLTHAALAGMKARGRGYIINLSSVAAFIPTGGGPGYCASKAYLNSFSTNLQSSLAGTGIKLQALCPGYTHTGFHSSDDYHNNAPRVPPRWLWMTAEDVVRYSLQNLESRKVIVVPGLKYRVIVFFLRSVLGRAVMSWRSRMMS